jgi:hypothetical protein
LLKYEEKWTNTYDVPLFLINLENVSDQAESKEPIKNKLPIISDAMLDATNKLI